MPRRNQRKSRNNKRKHKKPISPSNNNQSLPSTFKINLEMISDWHIGSGAGRTGDMDSLIKRDHNGLPYLPAKTITGIWRDACELVAQGLDNPEDNQKLENKENNGSWQQWVNYLFGDQPALAKGSIESSPRPAALSIRAAHFPEMLSALINSKEPTVAKQLKQAITFVKPGIKINSQSGVAEQDCLRLEEQVRMGAILSANCTLKLPEQQKQQKTAFALLIAGAKIVERLGGNRRRGSGKCCLTLPEVTHDFQTWVRWIEDHPVPPNIPSHDEQQNENSGETLSHQSSQTVLNSPQESQGESPNNNQIPNDKRKFVPLKIILRSPLVISQRTIGNVVETLDYIPGTHLLRLVARKLRKKLNINLTDAITKGDLLVTNGTIEINGNPGKPVPFALFYEKLGEGFKKGGKIYNRLVEAEPKGEQLKGYRSGYISQTATNSFPKYTTVPLTLGTHNTIEDQYQRPTGQVGGVYSYQAIKTGTIFRAELRLSQHLSEILTEKNPNWWQELKGGDRLGQSKKDDYGNVEIKVLNSPQKSQGDSPNNNQIPNDKLYVWLLSDLLLRDERLRSTISLDALVKELSKKLEVQVTEISSNSNHEDKQSNEKEDNNNTLTFIPRQNRLDSWQTKWGLPRPSLVGLGAGTCIVLNIDKPPEPAKLAEIEAKGIGERTAEGYGQLCFNHSLLTQEFPGQNSQNPEKNKARSNISNAFRNSIRRNSILFGYLRIIEVAAWREEIQRKATVMASQESERERLLGITINVAPNDVESKPSMSQLAALRSVVSRLPSPNDKDLTDLIRWIERVLTKEKEKVICWINRVSEKEEERDSSSKKWNECSLNKIKKILQEDNIIWQELEISSDLTLTQDAEQELQKQLWTEAVRTLINACILAHKRDFEKKINAKIGG